jgi:hypothetical protein
MVAHYQQHETKYLMTENFLIALIGLGGVILGSVLSWILSISWDSHKYKKERNIQALVNLRETLLAFIQLIEKNDYQLWSKTYFEVVVALNRVSVRDRRLRVILDELPRQELGILEGKGLENSIREAITIIDKLIS